jgi:hypothetical protein
VERQAGKHIHSRALAHSLRALLGPSPAGSERMVTNGVVSHGCAVAAWGTVSCPSIIHPAGTWANTEWLISDNNKPIRIPFVVPVAPIRLGCHTCYRTHRSAGSESPFIISPIDALAPSKFPFRSFIICQVFSPSTIHTCPTYPFIHPSIPSLGLKALRNSLSTRNRTFRHPDTNPTTTHMID